MTRSLLTCFALVFCLALIGCGSGGGPAEFDVSDSEPVTAEEEAEAEEYMEKMTQPYDGTDG